LCHHNPDLRGHVLYFQEVDSRHLPVASSLAGTGNCIVIFCIDSGPLSAYSGQLFDRVRNIWDRVDLTGAIHIRFNVLHFRFRPAEKGTAHVDYALFLPFQCLLQALVLQRTVLFMPVLYIVFGMPVDIMLVIGFYSWGMTWSFRPEG